MIRSSATTLVRGVATGLSTWILLSSTPAAVEDTVDEVLRRAGVYVLEFARQLSGIVAEEVYVQDLKNQMGTEIIGGSLARPVMHRELKSDILMVRTEEGYVQFRDVFEVDRSPVRDRQDRLTTLFLSKDTTAREQVVQITNDSARYNIGSIYRNINTPTLPLIFLESNRQRRFTFRRTTNTKPALGSGWSQGASANFAVADSVWVIEYQEANDHTIIRRLGGVGDMPSRGRFWIEPTTGRVLMTELIVGDPLIRCTLDVAYGIAVPGMLVPLEMRERYVNNQDRGVTTGTATYGRIRRFGVQVEEAIPEVR